MASIINATTAGLQETGDPTSQGTLDLQANGVSVVTLSSTTGARFTGNLFDNGIEVGVYAQAAFNTANNSATSVQSAYAAANNAATTASNAYAAANNAATTASNAYTAANVGSIFVTTGGTVSGNVSFANNVTVTQNLTIKSITETLNAIGTVTSSATLTLTDGTVQTATLTASTACTFTMPTATAGKSFVLLLKQAATTGGGTATFTGVKFGTSGAPTITATAGKMDILTFISDGTNWYGSIAQGYTP
jgi:hypothetical protein